MADDPATRVHAHVTRAAEILRATGSTLRNSVSSHVLPNTLAFPALETFCVNVTKEGGPRPEQLYLGSLDGNIVISARLRGSSASGGGSRKKKRGRDDAGDRASAACAKLVRMARAQEGAARERLERQVATAQQTIEQLLRNVKGPNDEECFESCGVSMAASVTTQASVAAPTTTPARPRLIVACRLSAGVALPLHALREALGACFRDGMLTTRPETLGPDYQLPLTEQGEATEGQGQRSMLLFAAVPGT